MKDQGPPDPAMKCGECKFSVEMQLPPPNIGRIRVCKLMPPTPMLMPTPNGQGVALTTQWPMIEDGSWCHQFVQKLHA